MKYLGPLALNEVRVAPNGQPVKLWQNNPAPRNGYWAIQPDGLMRFLPFAELAAMPLAANDAEAFPLEAKLVA